MVEKENSRINNSSPLIPFCQRLLVLRYIFVIGYASDMIPVGWADDGAAVVGGGPEVVGLDGIMYSRPIKKVIRGKRRDVESNSGFIWR